MKRGRWRAIAVYTGRLLYLCLDCHTKVLAEKPQGCATKAKRQKGASHAR